MKFETSQLFLYGVTESLHDKELLYDKVEKALLGGATMIQLRLKDVPLEKVVEAGKMLLPLCHAHNVPLIINDDPEAARLSGADGVHVGAEDMSVGDIREKYGADFIIGATAKTIEQATRAQAEGADYLGCGAVFPSPTKTGAIRITNDQLNQISQSVDIPVVAIGGINEENALSLQGADIAGIAVVSSLFAAKDIQAAANNLHIIAKQLTKGANMNYTTQMDAARKGIVTPQIAEVAKKENMPVEQLMKLVAEGKVAICANKNHKCLNPEGVGSMLRTKINVNLGVSRDCKDYDIEMQKVMSAVELGAEAIMDLSSHGNTQPFRKKLTSECPAMIGTVPVYDSVIHYQRDLSTLTAKDFIDVVRLHAKDGVDFVTLHCGITRKTIEQIKNHKRKMNIVSRGGSLVFAWMSMTGEENPFYEYYDEILDICEQYDVTISLGDACRPGCLADATDVCQIEELVRLGELTKRAWAHNVQVMVEGPGHMPLNQIAANMQVQQTICMGAPFYVLGPLVTDIAPGYDHITSAIGGAIAATNGAAFLCYVTPAEHLALPNVDDVKQGIIASKIAAHAADIAKGIPGARDIDDRMADARRNLDWEGQYACALDPDTAKAIRDSRMPEEDHSDTCSMCGKFCAVRSMNKALAGEYIDIL